MSETDKFDLNSLSEDERDLYLSERMKMFKLTVIICAFYGLIAVILIILALFTSWGQQFLYNEMFPFVITYIIGTIIIIIYLAYEVYYFEPVKSKGALGSDAEMCPDYWKIEYSGEEVARKDTVGKAFLPDDVNKSLFNYKCVLDPNVFDKEKIKENNSLKYTSNLYSSNNLYVMKELTAYDKATYKSDYGLIDEDQGKLFKEYAATMSGYSYVSKNDIAIAYSSNAFLDLSTNPASVNYYKSTIVPLICDSVYPMYMAVKDNEYQIKNPDAPSNKFRCAYAKACKISWTDAGCE